MTQQRTFEEIAGDVRRAQGGDAGAMERILGDVQDMVHYTCLRMLRSEDRAQDAAQDILIAVYQKLGTLADPMTYMSWVKRITANRCKNILTKTNREFLLEENEEGEDPFASFEDLDEQKVPDKALDSAESRRMVNDIVDALPDEQRLCVMLYYYDEMKTREIASALQVSEGTVKSRLNYARKSIKAGVDDLAKQGVKLYGGTPLPFLGYILQQSATSAVTPALVGPVMAAAGTTAAATATTATATAAIATTSTATGLGAFFGTLAGKAIVTVVAVAVISGAAAGVGKLREAQRAAEALASATAEPTVYVSPAPATHTPVSTNTPAPTAEPTPTPTATPTPTPEPPEHTFQRLTELPEEETAYLLDRFGTILAGENELGFVTDSPVAEIWEIHSLAAYKAFRETEAWTEDVPDAELACYGVRLADGTVLYLYLGDGLNKDGAPEHPWEIYRILLPEGGETLFSLDYLSGSQWTEWSTERPPEDALETKERTEYTARAVKTEVTFNGEVCGIVYRFSMDDDWYEEGLEYAQSKLSAYGMDSYTGAISVQSYPWTYLCEAEDEADFYANYKHNYLEGETVQYRFENNPESGKVKVYMCYDRYNMVVTFYTNWKPWRATQYGNAAFAGVTYDRIESQQRVLYSYRRR